MAKGVEECDAETESSLRPGEQIEEVGLGDRLVTPRALSSSRMGW